MASFQIGRASEAVASSLGAAARLALDHDGQPVPAKSRSCDQISASSVQARAKTCASVVEPLRDAGARWRYAIALCICEPYSAPDMIESVSRYNGAIDAVEWPFSVRPFATRTTSRAACSEITNTRLCPIRSNTSVERIPNAAPSTMLASTTMIREGGRNGSGFSLIKPAL